jgi:NADPH:quinone reductase-like Zn-dependent oxidoreductase
MLVVVLLPSAVSALGNLPCLAACVCKPGPNRGEGVCWDNRLTFEHHRSGYCPIAVTSPRSSALAIKYGAAHTAAYTSTTCVATIKSLAHGRPIRQVLDCITDIESVSICFAAMPRTGGRYASLEGLPEAWRTRRAIKTKEVMAYEGLGVRVDLGDSVYTREANQSLFEITVRWAEEVQSLLDAGLLETHPIREVPGEWEGIRGEKLVVRIAAL